MADALPDMTKPYGAEDFAADIESMKPRFVDIWVIPPLMLWFAYSAKSMHRWPRRMLFSAGIYMLYRNYAEYKKAALSVAAIASPQSTPVV
jgi:hypothetical protein